MDLDLGGRAGGVEAPFITPPLGGVPAGEIAARLWDEEDRFRKMLGMLSKGCGGGKARRKVNSRMTNRGVPSMGFKMDGWWSEEVFGGEW